MTGLQLAASSLFGIGQSLTTHLEQLLGVVLILFLGAKAFHHVGQDRPAAAVGLCLIAIIPALFVFDPGGAKSVLTSAVHAIGG